MSKDKTGWIPIICILLIVIYIMLLGTLFHNGFPDEIQRFLTPILLVYTMIMFGVSIALLGKNQKSMWGHILMGFGFYMLIYIPAGIITFVRGISVSAFWQMVNALFIVILLLDLIICILRKAAKSKSVQTKGNNILGTFILLLASTATFLLSLCFTLTIANRTVAEKKHNSLGYCLVIDGMDSQSVKYKHYIYCSKEDYMNAQIKGRYKMEYVNCTIFPIAHLENLDVPLETLEQNN
ncbi:MAG: hypothetical protein QM793_13375 [Muricomes sp.]